jgi:hypothetical protein
LSDSSTGGYLAPNSSPSPLEAATLNQVIQQAIAGMSGLPGSLVRPSFQSESPDIPDAGTAWCAFRYTTRPSDTFPAIIHQPAANNGNGQDELQRHEAVHVLASFYDQGTVGQKADTLAALVRDGFVIAQNREALLSAGIVLVSTGELTAVPVLIKQRWMYRVDLPFVLRRLIQRHYPVLNLLSAGGTINLADSNAETVVQWSVSH